MEKFVVYTDGGARGTPGPSACAAWFPQLGRGVSKFLGTQTNNHAEYQGLILGLREAYDLGHRQVEFFADSLLMVNQINGVYRVKSESLAFLHAIASGLIGVFSSFSITHVPRALNSDADALCNSCMDAEKSSYIKEIINVHS